MALQEWKHGGIRNDYGIRPGDCGAEYNDTTIIEELENQIKAEGAQKVLDPDY